MRTAVCMNVRNEARDIAEWMAFHAEVGFGTQIIFDNDSTDATRHIIQAAARTMDIRYHHWGQSNHTYQIDAYFTACHIYRHDFDWIAFLDSDEFLVLTAPQPIGEFLVPFGPFGGIAINWAIYGSNGHDSYPDGLLTETFTRRSPAAFFPNRHIKSIVQPKAVMGCENPHWFVLDAPYCDAAGRPMAWLENAGRFHHALSAHEPDYAQCRINHYFTRSRAHWIEKVRRGYPADIAIRKLEEFDEYDRNEVLDPIALRHAPAVRERVAAIHAAL